MLTEELLIRIATKTNIATEKLEHEINLLQTMPVLFALLENNKQKIGLYGGTALNKIYYGKRQRLSYDLDLFCYNFKDTLKLLIENGAKKSGLSSDARAALIYNDVKIDMWGVSKLEEEPKKLQVVSLLSFFDYPVVNSVAPSYSLEFLLARKLVAMSSRSLIRDIYDTWIGLQLIKNKKRFYHYLDREESGANLDVKKAFRDIIMKGVDYYKGKTVDAIDAPTAERMIKEIAEMLEVR